MSGALKGHKVFTPLVAFGFMLFVLIYFPCVAVIAAIKKESKPEMGYLYHGLHNNHSVGGGFYNVPGWKFVFITLI